jgi:uncharacterized protein (TIGR02147 family)
MTAKNAPHLRSFSDYRAFLKAWMAWRRAGDPLFNASSFSTDAGFQSRSFLSQLLSGERELSVKTVERVAHAMGLLGIDAEYFGLLVAFARSKRGDLKQELWDRILLAGFEPAIGELSRREFDFYGEWYIAPVRELAAHLDFGDDFAYLGRQLNPTISARQARHAVQTMVELGILIETEDGRYEQRELHIKAASEVKNLAIRQFQKNTLRLAEESLDRWKKDEREVSCMTIGTTAQAFVEIKQLIQEFQRQVVETVARNPGTEQVFQVNTQIYPLTRRFSSTGKGASSTQDEEA